MDSKVFLKVGVLIIGIALLSGCGGSSSSSSAATTTTTTTTTTPSVTGVVSQIQFTSASPTVIGIQGVGAKSTSTLTFTLVDVDGGTVSGGTVNFSLNTSAVGITHSSASSTSDSAGQVTTTVSAGDVPTSVVVTASLASDATIYAYSNQLTISTGHADQDSFSLSASVFNPEGGNHDGEIVTLTVHASDHSSNPVPDGSTVYFQAEGGQIQPACIIASGSCSVEWKSANRRPFDDGRVTVTATMIGEESFSDVNGNGVLDDTDYFIGTGHDMGEAFYDYNENGVFDATANIDQSGASYYEEFLDFDDNLAYTSADGEYNGVKCTPTNATNLCSTQTSTDVRQSLVLVMSNSGAIITFNDGIADIPNGSTLAIAGGVGASANIWVNVTDTHPTPQIMPAGTTVAVTVPTGLTLNSKASYTVINDNPVGPVLYYFPISASVGTSPGSGSIVVTVTTPKGLETVNTLYATW